MGQSLVVEEVKADESGYIVDLVEELWVWMLI